MPDRGMRRSGDWSTNAGRFLEETSAPLAPSSTEKVPTVRVTVDLPRDDHRALKRSAEDIADELGVARVSLQQVMAALAHRVAEDQDLREYVTLYLRRSVAQ